MITKPKIRIPQAYNVEEIKQETYKLFNKSVEGATHLTREINEFSRKVMASDDTYQYSELDFVTLYGTLQEITIALEDLQNFCVGKKNLEEENG